jgi:mono/diheme cytochrome c family protein
MMRTRWFLIAAMAAAMVGGPACGGDPDESVLPGVDALVFVKRAFIGADGEHVVTGGANQTIDYLRYVPGGGVYVLSPPTPDGELTNLTEAFEGADVNGIDLSFDARQVVFSMRYAGQSHYHIYLANVDGSGEVRQLTFGDWHDVKPVFVPGDRIAFVTNQPYTEMGTRADEYNHSRVVTQLATISLEAGDADRRLCAQNLSHSADPFLMFDGRIGFSRWEHLGPLNDVKLMVMNPDCTQMVGLAGTGGKPGNSLVQFHEMSPGEYVGIVTSRRGTIQAGALVHLDALAEGGVDGIVLDEQNARFDVLTPQVPTGEESPPSGVGRYRRPFPLDNGQLLVAWADGDVNERNELSNTAPNFGLYLWDPETRSKTLIYDDPNTWDTYAIPVVPRDAPTVHPSLLEPAPDESEPSVLGSVDVSITGLSESVRGADLDGLTLDDALDFATRVRIIEGFSSEIGPVREFGLTMHEGAAILGEASVYEDGSWEAAVPARLPYHLQPLDRYGMAIRNQMLWIQAMPGEERRCGGCHEDRTGQVLPREGATTLAQQAGAQDFVRAIPDRVELPWIDAASGQTIQDVLDANCVSCHDGGASDPYAGRTYQVSVTTEEGEMLEYDIPYLRLDDEPLQVYYEMEVVSYPASYVTLLYPSAMMGDSVASGDVPPEWVQPGTARTSRLIEALNINAEDDANAWAWETPSHPEDVGVDLTREERLMLIQMADLGGQFYSRRNVEGAEAWGEVDYE